MVYSTHPPRPTLHEASYRYQSTYHSVTVGGFFPPHLKRFHHTIIPSSPLTECYPYLPDLLQLEALRPVKELQDPCSWESTRHYE